MARVLGASLVIVLLVVGCARLPAGSAPGSPAPESATPPASAAAPTSPPSWTRVDGPPGIASDIVWTGSRFVASADSDVLVSENAISWRRSPLPGEGTNLRRLAVGPAGVVGVGYRAEVDDVDSDQPPVRIPMIWASADGVVWRAAPGTAFAAPAGREIALSGVTATPRGWVAVGVERRVSELYFPEFTADNIAAVWTSPDGLTWARVPTTPALRAGEMRDVAAMGPRIVAVGGVPDAVGSSYHAMAWISDDGMTWARALDTGTFDRTDPSTLGAAMTSVATDGTVVAAGGVMPGDPGWAALAWWSTDGVHWSRATGEAMAGGQVFDLTPMSTGFLMTGPSQGCNGVRSSVDGRAWVCADPVPAMDGFAAYASATSGTVDVVVGLRDEGSRGEIWVRASRR